MKQQIYVLQHSYELENGYEETKFLGVFSSFEKAKAAIEQVSKVRSLLGATQNRLDHTLANLEETTTNLTEAESRIRDTDMAKEMMLYIKNNILIQN